MECPCSSGAHLDNTLVGRYNAGDIVLLAGDIHLKGVAEMQTGKVVLIALALLITSSLAQKPTPENISRLKREADRVLKLSFVNARAKVDVVFDLAQALSAAGRPNEALKYYEEGLRRHAWALEHQLAYAQLLTKVGKKDLAKERAEIVAGFAEADELVVPALKLLGRAKEADRKLPSISKLKGTGPAVVLVPMGKVDVLVLKQVRKALQDELGIPVLVQKASIRMPPPAREPLKEYLKEVRPKIMGAARTEEGKQVLRQLNLTVRDLRKDEELMRFMKKFITVQGGEEAAEAFVRGCERLEDKGKQWNAGQLVAALRPAVRPHGRRNVKYVGVTRRDMCSKDWGFLFGLRIGDYAVVSYGRFRAEFHDETPNRKRLVARTLKQCLSSTGHAFGLGRCSSPRCARTYPHSVAEHDAKSAKLCSTCRNAFAKAFAKAGKSPESK